MLVLRCAFVCGLAASALVAGNDQANAGSLCKGEGLVLPVLEVGDGDTIDVEVTLKNGQRPPVTLRIEGINAPETREDLAKCPAEIEAGRKAKAFAESLLGYNAVVYFEGKHDFFSRQLVCVELSDGRSYAQAMIEEGHAVKGTRGGEWCK